MRRVHQRSTEQASGAACPGNTQRDALFAVQLVEQSAIRSDAAVVVREREHNALVLLDARRVPFFGRSFGTMIGVALIRSAIRAGGAKTRLGNLEPRHCHCKSEERQGLRHSRRASLIVIPFESG